MSNISLFVDIGNTAVKWLFDDKYHSVLIPDFTLDLLPKTDQVFVSCVGDKSLLSGLNGAVFVKSSAQFQSFKSAYDVPQNLGVDRFLTMIGAMHLYPKKNIFLIDAGSALTFDLLLKSGEHQGGLIMPGLGKLRNSFDQFSSDDRRITLNKLANNTQEAWETGTAEMLMGVVNHQIEQQLNEQGDLKIILTGGDAKMIALKVAHSVEVHQNLVLDALVCYVQTYAD